MKSRIVAWGVALLVVGCTLFFSVWGSQGFGAVEYPEQSYEKKSRVIDRNFTSVTVMESSANVHIEPSPDGVCRVEYMDSSRSMYKISIEDDCLIISRESVNGGKWWENITLFIGTEEQLLLLYLPENEYASLSVSTASGDIYAGGGFNFDRVEANTASGDVDLGNVVRKDLSVNTASGDIRVGKQNLESIELGTASGSIALGDSDISFSLAVGTASGDIELSDINCGSLEADSASGSIELRSVIVSNKMEIDTASGDIRLDYCDAASLELESTSGYISGTLLSGKNFEADTTSGLVKLPESTGGGKCRISTVSGNIDIRVE